MSDNKNKHDRAMDGMIREYARGGTGKDLSYVKRVIDAIHASTPTALEPLLNWFFSRRLATVAAAVMAIGIVLVSLDTHSLMAQQAATGKIILYSGTEFTPGASSPVRLSYYDDKSGAPMPDAAIALYLEREGTDERLKVGYGTTDAHGYLTITPTLPEDVAEGDYRLVAETDHEKKGTVFTDKTVTIKRSHKCMLTTDKPLYKPGQTIHIRTLTMATTDLKPAKGTPVTLEVLDGKENKVFKKTVPTSAYGIAAADFILADQVNLGHYVIAAQIGDTRTEKMVEVKEYVLPKFKIGLTTDRGYYRPGDVAKITVNAMYTFGKPVIGGKVEVEAKEFVAGIGPFSRLFGQTDADGNCAFELKLKSSFVGTARHRGDAKVLLDTTVIDPANHKLQHSRSVTVSNAPLRVDVIPESGALVPGVENRIFVVTSYPDGRPATCTVSVHGAPNPVQTTEYGVATLAYLPIVGRPLSLAVADVNGNKTSATLAVGPASMVNSVLLRPDKAVYRTGQSLQLQILSTTRTGRVFIDVIREGRAILMSATDVTDGKGELVLDLDDQTFGTLELHAYFIQPDGRMVGDTRVVQVNRANGLTVKATLDKPTYRPGERAVINFLVENANGNPEQAALSLAVVDEAVFALSDMRPGFEQIYFALQAELLEPRFQINGILPFDAKAAVLEKSEGIDQPSRRQAGSVVFSAAEEVDGISPVPGMGFVDRNANLRNLQAERFDKVLFGLALIPLVLAASLVIPLLAYAIGSIRRKTDFGVDESFDTVILKDKLHSLKLALSIFAYVCLLFAILLTVVEVQALVISIIGAAFILPGILYVTHRCFVGLRQCPPVASRSVLSRILICAQVQHLMLVCGIITMGALSAVHKPLSEPQSTFSVLTIFVMLALNSALTIVAVSSVLPGSVKIQLILAFVYRFVAPFIPVLYALSAFDLRRKPSKDTVADWSKVSENEEIHLVRQVREYRTLMMSYLGFFLIVLSIMTVFRRLPEDPLTIIASIFVGGILFTVSAIFAARVLRAPATSRIRGMMTVVIVQECLLIVTLAATGLAVFQLLHSYRYGASVALCFVLYLANWICVINVLIKATKPESASAQGRPRYRLRVAAAGLTLVTIVLLGVPVALMLLVASGGMAMKADRGVIMESKMAMKTSNLDIDITESEGQREGAKTGRPSVATRIRRYFPETLFWQPQLITDSRGNARLELSMADSITTWRMSMSAVSKEGLLGSADTGIRVFQDFFVDIDFPTHLTQNDRVSVPVSIFNYMKTKQDVELNLQPASWYVVEGSSTRTVTLKPGEVRAVSFTLTAKAPGRHALRVNAKGAQISDAVERTVRVKPDGREVVQTINGELDASKSESIIIPADAITGGSDLFLKVYPGAFSQVVEGLDGIFRMPHGCFEQTSSTTYPNVLVLNYLRQTKQVKPELEMKALQYINTGYQRLTSFEIDGGGFDWYGNPPADVSLSAYGLMEFCDMSKVYEVDQKLISRTREWLLSKQNGDGSWHPGNRGFSGANIHDGRALSLKCTAYVTWALGEAGGKPSQLETALDYLTKHCGETRDPYTLALCANALIAGGRDASRLLDTLDSLKKTKDKLTWWESQGTSCTYGRGSTMNVETTALAAYAYITSRTSTLTANRALSWLISQKDPHGTWYSTQATVHAFRALLAGSNLRSTDIQDPVELAVIANGARAQTLVITKDNSEVFWLVDLKPFLKEGKNTVSLEPSRSATLGYQIVAKHYLPTVKKPVVGQPKILEVDVAYDKKELATNDLLKATVTLKYNGPGRANMTIVDLGVPPGFAIQEEDFRALVTKGVVEKYSATGNQVILYFRQIRNDRPVIFSYGMRAKYPVKAKTPVSTAYQYYQPEIKDMTTPEVLIVR